VIILSARPIVGNTPHGAARQICRWPTDYYFGFNIGNPAHWKKYLQSATFGGMALPRRTKRGNPVGYRVYIWGGIPGYSNKSVSGLTLFPGRTPMGAKLPLSPFGRLDVAFAVFGEEGGI